MSEVSLRPLRVAMMKTAGRSDAGTFCWCALLFFAGCIEAAGVVIWRFLCYQVDDSRVNEVLVGPCFKHCETVHSETLSVVGFFYFFVLIEFCPHRQGYLVIR